MQQEHQTKIDEQLKQELAMTAVYNKRLQAHEDMLLETATRQENRPNPNPGPQPNTNEQPQTAAGMEGVLRERESGNISHVTMKNSTKLRTWTKQPERCYLYKYEMNISKLTPRQQNWILVRMNQLTTLGQENTVD